MSGRTVHGAIILLVLGNFLALLSDTLIKAQGGDIPVFQFVFMRKACTLLMLLPLLRFVDFTQPLAGFAIHAIRAHLGLVGITCMVIALNTLPLATANALFYAAPVLVMVLAVVFYGEKLTRLSLLAVISGFLGIVVMLRPMALNWESLTALVTALSLAISALLVRKLPRHQHLIHTMLLIHVIALPGAALLFLWEGAAWDWSMLPTALGSSFFILGYNMTVILAYRHVDANQVTSAEYTGLIWAVLLGWVLFAEVPDLWFVAGAVMIVGPLFLLSLRERRAHLSRRRARLAAEATTHPT
ncbi:DMT family transporter [Natronospirillum operosum]|uniref:DMT family transporter n=1 Tax=Natronospirillum operosum TaxID=2759953 RepID=A0A4Z0W7F1_9GAMM|nr:DMT family transporter [Natronospirillum operosum]TGG93307.1 DMT family transporter [Natronospirillum operosum]